MTFVAVLVGVVVCAVSNAEAGAFNRHHQSWLAYYSPWCLHTSTEIEDCGYATLAQCQVSRSGVGGSCNPNPRYTEATLTNPAAKSRKSKRIDR
jgi:hypothetical protein